MPIDIETLRVGDIISNDSDPDPDTQLAYRVDRIGDLVTALPSSATYEMDLTRNRVGGTQYLRQYITLERWEVVGRTTSMKLVYKSRYQEREICYGSHKGGPITPIHRDTETNSPRVRRTYTPPMPTINSYSDGLHPRLEPGSLRRHSIRQ